MRRIFAELRERIGETAYLAELARFHLRSTDDILSLRPAAKATETALKCYARMLAISEQQEAA